MDVYRNKEDREKYLNKYFTEEGIRALEARLESLGKLYTEDREYPFIAKMLGFVTLTIKSREHHEGMMDNLMQILGVRELVIKNGK